MQLSFDSYQFRLDATHLEQWYNRHLLPLNVLLAETWD